MQNTLTTLHYQFQKKHLEISEIGEKIQSFMQNYKSKTQIKRRLASQIKLIKEDVNNLKQQFQFLREDLVTYGQLPNQFIKMVIQLPSIYEGFWENRQQQLKRSLMIKDQQCKMLKQKLSNRQHQNDQLRQKISLFEIKLNELYAKQDISKVRPDSLKQKRIIQTSDVVSRQNIDGMDDLDSYIENMQITIRQNDQPLFKRITQQGSQQQEQDSHYQPISSIQQNQLQIRRNKTARPTLILHQLGNSYDLIKKQQKLKIPDQSFIKQFHRQKSLRQQVKKLDRTQQIISKSKFWNNLTKNIQNNPKQKVVRQKSQSKQNIELKQFGKLSHAQKRILTSKITDFRKLLFVEKGIQRLGFKI